MATPAKALPALLVEVRDRVNDFAHSVDELTLQRYIRLIALEIRAAEARGVWGLELAMWYGATGSCRLRQKDYDRALEAYAYASKICPDIAEYQNNMAAVLLDSGHPQEALERIRFAYTLPDANGLLLLFLLTNEAEALIKLGDNKAGRRAFESAVRVVATDSPNANMAVAKHASEIGYEHDAVEFFARYLLLTSGRTRGDLPAVEVIRSIPEEASIVMAHRTELADCVRRVTAEWDAPISGDPDDDVNPRIRLEPEAWGRFARLAGLTSGA